MNWIVASFANAVAAKVITSLQPWMNSMTAKEDTLIKLVTDGAAQTKRLAADTDAAIAVLQTAVDNEDCEGFDDAIAAVTAANLATSQHADALEAELAKHKTSSGNDTITGGGASTVAGSDTGAGGQGTDTVAGLVPGNDASSGFAGAAIVTDKG